MKKKQLITNALIGFALYLIATGVSFAAFTFAGTKKQMVALPTPATKIEKTGTHFNIDPAIPRTEACPINGVLYTKQEKETWDKRRPLAVMIENHAESRPQSGLSYADVVYEAVAEGGVTRFMGIFYCGIAGGAVSLAPVRSARMYFLPWVLEYDALYNHVGGAGRCSDDTVDDRAKALCQIEQFKIKDMDQFGLDFKACHRVTNRLDHEVAFEHTMACYTDELYKVAESRGWTNVDQNSKNTPWDKNFTAWKFKDPSTSPGQAATDIKFDFWASMPDYSVEWRYDSSTNSYKRINGGKQVVDQNTGKQIVAKNVVVQQVLETGPIDEHQHMIYDIIGKGKMLVFQDGKVATGTWFKSGSAGRTKFVLDNGKEVQFNGGLIWVEWVPAANQITYN